MNHTIKSMLIAAAALTAVSSFAQDKATLDLLVKKGLITAEERAKTLDEASQARAVSGINRVFPKEDATKRLTISGYFQSQYENFFSSSSTTNAGVVTNNYATQSGFIMRRLYLDILADIGEGISANVVMDMSGNTNSRNSQGKESFLDRAMLSLAGSYGTFDLGYRKVTWGYEESTLSSLFKASSSKLLTVERGITNRYWNEAENGRRLGFGAHHTGLFYTSVANPQGFEYGAALTNANRDLNAAGGGQNDIGAYANVVWNNKVSDNEKYAIGINYGKTRYTDGTTGVVASSNAKISGYNPFVQVQYFNWAVSSEYFRTHIKNPTTATADKTPKGYNLTVSYKINDNYEGVARYTSLNTDGRGQQISDGDRDYSSTGGIGTTYNKSHAYYLGLNYYFTLSALGSAYYGNNAKIQLGYETASFSGGAYNTGSSDTTPNQKARVNSLRLQAQVAF